MNFLTRLFVAALIILFTAQVRAAGQVPDSPYCSLKPPKDIPRKMYIWPEWEKKNDYFGYEGRGWNGDGWKMEKHYRHWRQSGWHGHQKLKFCHGDAPETATLYYVWPTWDFNTREAWFYPIQIVDTVAGVLVSHGSEPPMTVWLNGTPLIDVLDTGFITWALPEKAGKPEIIFVALESAFRQPPLYTNLGPDTGDFIEDHIVDLGVSPPFISPKGLPIGWYDDPEPTGHVSYAPLPVAPHIKVERPDANTFIYSRKGRTVTEIRADNK